MRSLLRALCLTTSLRLSITTVPVPSMAESSRVTMNMAWLVTSVLTLCLTSVLACALIESAVLLRTSMGGPVMVVCVTVSSRCRLVERPVLLVAMGALQFPGRCWTKLLVPVAMVVVCILLLAVLSPLKWTPLVMALWNRRALRSMTFRSVCRSVPLTLCMLTLLQATRLVCMLQKWPTRPATAAPFVFAEFMKVTPRLGPVNSDRPLSMARFGLQLNAMLRKCMLLVSGIVALLEWCYV